MHGAGNDFVLVDARHQLFEPTPERARAICDRRFGIGCDQVMVVREPESSGHLARYEIWNPDGSMAAQCGNGARCVALYLERNGDYPGRPFTVEGPAGVVGMQRCDDGEYELDMGVPDFDASAVPLTLQARDGRYTLESPWGVLSFGAVSMGNPHALVLVDDIGDDRIPAMGAWMGAHEAFPDRVNAGFAQVLDRGAIRLRVIERGVGETPACGSGACAAVATLARRGLLDERADVLLAGGRLVIKWPGKAGPIRMKGPAEHVFRGTMDE